MSRKNPAAVALGRKGGAAKTDVKSATARQNGAKGGRPIRIGSINVAAKGLPGDRRDITWHPQTHVIRVGTEVQADKAATIEEALWVLDTWSGET